VAGISVGVGEDKDVPAFLEARLRRFGTRAAHDSGEWTINISFRRGVEGRPTDLVEDAECALVMLSCRVRGAGEVGGQATGTSGYWGDEGPGSCANGLGATR
jgi:hypothetical protein